MTNKLLKILIINTFVLVFFNFAHPVTPEMLASKNMPDSINGIMYSFMSLGMVVGSLYFGKKIITVENTIIMTICLIGYGITQQFLGFGNTIVVMSLGRFLSGIFASGWMVTSLQYINKNTTESTKTRFFAYLMVSNAVAAIIGQILAGFLGTKFDYHYIFILQFFGLFIISLTTRLLKVDNTVDITTDNLDKKKEKVQLKLGDMKNIHYPLLLMFLFALAFTAINSQIGYFVSTDLNKGTFFVGFINSYINVITLIVNLFIINTLYHKLRSPKIFIVQSGITLFGIMILVFFNLNFVIAITFIMLGLVAYKPVLQKLILESEKLADSVSLGYINSANSLGMVLGSFISGVLYAASPIYVLYFVFFIMLFIIIISIKKKN